MVLSEVFVDQFENCLMYLVLIYIVFDQIYFGPAPRLLISASGIDGICSIYSNWFLEICVCALLPASYAQNTSFSLT